MDPAAPLVERDVLPADINAALDGCLAAGEVVELVLPGLDSAVIATDRRVFMARRGELVRDPVTGEPAAWAYRQFRRVRFEADRIAGTLVLLPADPADRGLILLFDERTSERVRLGAQRLTEKLREAGSLEAAEGEVPGSE